MQKYILTFFLFYTSVFSDEVDFEHDGWNRQCYLYKPSCIPDEPSEDFESVPLVFMIHGLGGEGEDFYDFSSLAEDSCFIVAFPSGIYNTWNAGPETIYGHDIDDNGYLHALIDTVYNNYPIDTNKIYLTGHSMGGMMANHLNCTSTRFTAFGSSGGAINNSYNLNSEYHYLCNTELGNYAYPIIFTQGRLDDYVPWEWAFMSGYHWLLNSRCAGVPSWPYDFDWPGLLDIGNDITFDMDDLYDEVIATADTLLYGNPLERYQWSSGCVSEPSVEFVFLNTAGHAWHLMWNSAISSPLEHWNFFRQFSKDKVGPALDSLELNDGEITITLDNDYYVNGETTPIKILAMDNYSVASITVSFSGIMNVEGFDIDMTFNTDNQLLNIDTSLILSPDISTDSYDIVQIRLTDHDGNEKVYESEELHDLGFYSQMAVLNNITTSTSNEPLNPETFALHQNYPNPFNPETNINYDLPKDGLVSISIYDMRGTLVKTLVEGNQTSGFKTITWDGTNEYGHTVSAGLYMYQLKTNNIIHTKKMALLK